MKRIALIFLALCAIACDNKIFEPDHTIPYNYLFNDSVTISQKQFCQNKNPDGSFYFVTPSLPTAWRANVFNYGGTMTQLELGVSSKGFRISDSSWACGDFTNYIDSAHYVQGFTEYMADSSVTIYWN